MTNKEKLKALSTKSNENWLEIANELERDEAWLDKSAKIAFSVLDLLKKKNMTKQELADKMGVKAQYVSRIVKGTENLTLETISKLEIALDAQIIEVEDTSSVIVAEPAVSVINRDWRKGLSFSFSETANDSMNNFLTQMMNNYYEPAYA